MTRDACAPSRSGLAPARLGAPPPPVPVFAWRAFPYLVVPSTQAPGPSIFSCSRFPASSSPCFQIKQCPVVRLETAGVPGTVDPRNRWFPDRTAEGLRRRPLPRGRCRQAPQFSKLKLPSRPRLGASLQVLPSDLRLPPNRLTVLLNTHLRSNLRPSSTTPTCPPPSRGPRWTPPPSPLSTRQPAASSPT